MKPLLAAGAASALFAGVSAAQALAQPPNDYNHHWATAHHAGLDIAFSGPGLFNPAPFGGSTTINYASIGDTIRRCYSVDMTQGGRNQSTGGYGPPGPLGQPIALPGFTESSSMRFVGGFAGANQPAFQNVNLGPVTIRSASDTDVLGDACFFPFSPTSQASAPTVITGIAFGSIPFPTVWISVWHFSSTTGGFTGFTTPTTLGTAFGPTGGGPYPLLTNVLFEVQGPLNGGPGNNLYFIGTTSERTGLGNAGGPLGVFGTGGVTNGNAGRGFSLFGVTADVSAVVSHTRMTINDVPGGTLYAGAGIMQPVTPNQAQTEMYNSLGFNTPGLWSFNDGDWGAGGPDWVASVAPVSIVDMLAHDMWYGSKANPSSAASDPCAGFLGFNLPIFLWSGTPANQLPDSPMSWDDLGVGTFVQPGSFLFGRFLTFEEGFQTIPANFDTVTTVFLTFTGLTLGTTYTQSQDAFFGDPSASPLFQGWAFTPWQYGISGFSAGPVPCVGTAKPNFAGIKLGVAAIGVNLPAPAPCPNALVPLLTHVHNSLTLNLQ